MKKILIFFCFIFSWAVFSQISPHFIQLKPSYRNHVKFIYTGAIQTWTVPAGVTQIFVDLAGAQGANFNTNPGGRGGKISCLLSVTPGTVLQITVGGQSTTNTPLYGFGGNGGLATSFGNLAGAGGGLSAISTLAPVTHSNALVIAGGGGGSAGGSTPGLGGDGGGVNGIDGLGIILTKLLYGRGGTQTAGGGAGTVHDPNSTPPTAGIAIRGGNGGIVTGFSTGWNGGGGGGAGYYGGGGGVGGGNAQGGGGGGSSWAHPSCTQVSSISKFNIGNGRIFIYYN